MIAMIILVPLDFELDTILTAILGLSFGFQLPTVIVPVQNALDLDDTGIGLSTIMFFRLIGAAFGVALLTALLVAQPPVRRTTRDSLRPCYSCAAAGSVICAKSQPYLR
jgi:hypothetical protein